ncbi:SulP family inorganic anion transporter [Terrabacter aerolatus]|uniref:Sulfate transporter n=1 Tax=Terrabacter aerolatus TaxID=422442 RepID=A0A512D0X4_9MICO|nr:SulP family inorganic anion transporter [Terrabacter aerolatus]GEO30105.1 sulfate transporter [Terrabacter aerolatus]
MTDDVPDPPQDRSVGHPPGDLVLPSWLRGYRRSWWRPDAVAGLTVWAVLIPEALAYATIAGVPPVVGLYAAVPALVLYALLGSSRHLVVGPMSATSALSGAIAIAYGGGTPEGALRVTATLAIVVGAVGLVAGLLRLGFLTSFISEPVLKGFIIGLALTIIIGQVPKLLEVDKPEAGFFRSVAVLVSELGDAHWLSAAVGIVALAVVLVLRRVSPRVPGSLVVVLLGIVAVRLFSLDERGVAIVGPIQSGLPAVGLPGSSPAQYAELVAPALGVLLVGFVEGLAAAKAYATTFGYDIDTNRELTAAGVANLGSGLFGGLVVNGSLSKTAVNGSAGAQSQASNVLVSALTVLTLLFLTGLFESLPEPVLAAVVIAAVIDLVDMSSLRRLYAVWTAPLGSIYRSAARADFIAAVGALLGVLVLDTLPGLFVGVLLSLLLLLYRTSRPHVARLTRQPGATGEWLDASRHPDLQPPADVAVVRVESGLFFVNADHVRDEIRAALTPGTRAVVIDASSVPAIDVSAADMLAQLHDELARQGRSLHLAAGIGQFRDVVGAAEGDQLLGNVHPSVDEAVTAARRPASGGS